MLISSEATRCRDCHKDSGDRSRRSRTLTHVAAITRKPIRLAYCATVETIMFYMGGCMLDCVVHIVPVASTAVGWPQSHNAHECKLGCTGKEESP